MKSHSQALKSVVLPDGSFEESLRSAASPGPDFRGLPFWSWNSKLTPTELRTQIRIFRDMGFGGFFMHPREGLATEYLEKEWFDCVRACADEARKLGMRAWAYDEDRWPSGAAGGLVTASLKYRNRGMHREEVNPSNAPSTANPREKTVALFAEIPADGDAGKTHEESGKNTGERLVDVAHPPVRTILRYRRVSGLGAKLRPSEKLFRYVVRIADGQPRFNGGAYLDVLNPAAVREFVRTTQAAYAKELGNEVSASGAIPGFFTDEPSVLDPVPWTTALPAVFKRKFGYDVVEHLPELYSRIGDETWSKVRHDFRECITTLFCESYAGTIGRWCGKHDTLFTGHVLDEDTPRRQTDRVGSAMRVYEKMQAPGIDMLTEHWLPIITAKQCSSAARQCGREFRLCETYGCTGWDFPLEGHKALGDWLLALGINHKVHHLAWYSMEGRVKRDYPASISRQSPWFRKYKAMEDYFARAGEFAGRGREERDLLVLHPVESVWGNRVLWCDQPDLEKRDDSFVALSSALLSRHLDFDFGDEDILARRGKVATARRHGSAPALKVGKAKYRAILLPPHLETIRSSTLNLLRAFAASGGAVFASGAAPVRVDASQSDAAFKAWRNFRAIAPDADSLDAALSPLVRRVSIADSNGECASVIVHERSRRDGTSYFVCNTSTDQPTTVAEMMGGAPAVRDRKIEYPDAVLRIPVRGSETILEIDLETGDAHRVAFTLKDGFAAIPCPLKRLETRLFVVPAKDAAFATSAVDVAAGSAKVKEIHIPRNGFAYSLDEPNALVLDMAEWEFAGAPSGASDGKHPLTHVLDIDRAARLSLGIAPRGGKPPQPWAVEAAKKGLGPWAATGHLPPHGKQPSGVITLHFRFKAAPSTADIPCELALERPDLWRVEVNGEPLSAPRRATWWIDPCLKRLPIPAKVMREGTNKITMRCDRFDADHPGLESIFLLGAFGVLHPNRADKAEIRPLPKSLRLGDLSSQGLGNYGGNITYRFRAAVPTTGAVRLAPKNWKGTAIGFKANGGKEIFRPAPPYEGTIGGASLRRDGTDEFEITVYGSRRNALGPFYIKGGVAYPYWTGNAEIDATAEAPCRALVPFGLL